MRKSTLILLITLVAILSMGSKTIYQWYAPLTSGTSGQILVSAGANAHPTWGDLQYRYATATKKSGVLGSVTCYRYGRVVTLVFDQFNIPSSIGTMAECVTIPAGYRPRQWLIGGLVTTTSASGGINISPSTGVSQLFGSYNLNYYGCVTYITADAMP